MIFHSRTTLEKCSYGHWGRKIGQWLITLWSQALNKEVCVRRYWVIVTNLQVTARGTDRTLFFLLEWIVIERESEQLGSVYIYTYIYIHTYIHRDLWDFTCVLMKKQSVLGCFGLSTGKHRRFGEGSKDLGSKLFRNFGNYWPVDMA